MANANFKVQNGLEVGPAIVFAANGDIITAGNITTTGSGTIVSANGFGGLNPNQIYSGTSNVTVTSGYVNVAISNTNVASFNSTGLSTTGDITVGGNLTVNGTTVTINATTVTTNDKTFVVANNQTTGSGVDGSGLDAGGGTPIATWRYNNATTSWQSNVNITPTANATINLGGTSNWFNNVYGVTFIGTSTTAKYADLAENYAADVEYEPGTVVCFGGEAEVTQCDIDSCQRVAGVVSTDPAYLMNSELQGIRAAVALQGRVPCKVVGPVRKGDMMVAAGNGRARAEADPKLGAVIGKALENFDGTEGVIEVVVGRI